MHPVYAEPTPATYEGTFLNGRMEGEGTLTIPGRYRYNGTFTGDNVTGRVGERQTGRKRNILLPAGRRAFRWRLE